MSDAHSSPATGHAAEVRSGERFEFGKNWQRFAAGIDEQRIAEAERSLREMLGVEDLQGRAFLDVGSGSGLFSLAARRLGARVVSFDYDPASVACTASIKERFASHDDAWTIREGSVLDAEFMRDLGQFDVVYAWGMLHQTGDMWRGLQHCAERIADSGWLFVSLYNDQGGASHRWRFIKKCYNRWPAPLKTLLVLSVGAYFESRAALVRISRFQNPLPFRDWAAKRRTRGMSVWHDLVDWVGGYPFEVAKPDELVAFGRERDLTLLRLGTVGSGHGCNEYVFRRVTGSNSGPGARG